MYYMITDCSAATRDISTWKRYWVFGILCFITIYNPTARVGYRGCSKLRNDSKGGGGQQSVTALSFLYQKMVKSVT